MLLNLHVKNLAVIDEIEVEFSDGLNVLTGETGAGKSIIIGSINIALGGKVSRDIIRKGTEFALIECRDRWADMRTGEIGDFPWKKYACYIEKSYEKPYYKQGKWRDSECFHA